MTIPLFLLILSYLSSSFDASSVVWIGAVTATSFKINLDIPPNATELIISTHSNFTTTADFKNITEFSGAINDPWSGSGAIYGYLRTFTFTGLQPTTDYFIATNAPDTQPQQVATVRTFPKPGIAADITLALGSCQRGVENDVAYEDIRYWYDKQNEKEKQTFMMLHMGDMTYSDISDNSLALYEQSLRSVLERDRVRSVFSRMPVSYMYDDHDYGDNNSGFMSPSRDAALHNYRNMVPSYDLPSREASYHAFTVGTVRIIMSDTRALADRDTGSTLGLSQREWFLQELRNASSYDVVVWMTSKPWIGEADLGKDSWAAYPSERMLISETLAALNVTNLVAVAGDAHMLAADDGRNTDYSGKGGGFPVFQAAPLSNRGSSKGGPYSQGCVAWKLFRNEQYGILRITRVGKSDGPCVEFRGYKAGHKVEPEIIFQRCGRLSGVLGSGGQDGSCNLAVFPTWVYVIIILSVIWTLTMIALGIALFRYCIWRRRRSKAFSRDSELDSDFTSDRTDESSRVRDVYGRS